MMRRRGIVYVRGVCAGAACLVLIAGTTAAAPDLAPCTDDPAPERESRARVGGEVARLVDEAAQTLADLGSDWSDASALFGIPTRAQRGRVARAAAACLSKLEQAEKLCETETARLEASLLDRSLNAKEARERAAQVEPELARLVDVEQGVRIPYYRSCARVLQASVEADVKSRAVSAAQSADVLRQASFTTAEAEAWRLVHLAAADLLTTGAGGGKGDKSARERAAASLRAAFALVAARGASDAEGSSARRAAVIARMGMISIEAGDPGAQSGAARPVESWPIRLLMAEAAARATPTATARLNRLLELAREAARADASVGRLLAYAKISAATGPGTPFGALDPELAFARAITIVRESADEPGTPDAATPPPPSPRPVSAEALALLRQVADRPVPLSTTPPSPPSPSSNAAGDLRPEALWELAVVHSRSDAPGSELASLRALHELVVRHPRSARAPDAAERLAALWTRACGTGKVAATTSTSGAASELWPLCVDGLEFLARSERVEARTSRDELADRLVQLYLCAPESRITRIESLRRAVESVEPLLSGPIGVRNAAAARVGTAIEDAVRDARSPVNGSGSELLALRVRWMELTGVGAGERAAATVDWAESLIGVDDRRAADLLTSIRGTTVDAPGSALHARVTLLLADAHVRLNNTASAFTLLRGLTEEFEGRTTALGYTLGYWGGWSALLELLVSTQNEPGAKERAEQIRGHIRRLELLDAALGGEPYRTRIGAIRDSLK